MIFPESKYTWIIIKNTKINNNTREYDIYCTQNLKFNYKTITHFNKEHPENQNIYISCLKSDVAMMYENQKWITHAWPDIADRIINDNVDMHLKEGGL